jgi:UPF0271 protein
VAEARQQIDLNADVGEGETILEELLGIVSSCNIACGGHIGDAVSMRRTLDAAIAHNVVAGAHPSYPDREGFGRRSRFLPADALAPELEAQIRALCDMAALSGARIAHVKPHGALYNDAAIDRPLADAVTAAVRAVDPALVVVGPPGSELAESAGHAGLCFAAEGFVDRAYMADGSLVPRGEPGAVYECAGQAAAQAVDIATQSAVTAIDGTRIPLDVETLCIHGDTPGAAASAAAVREALETAGVRIIAPHEERGG